MLQKHWKIVVVATYFAWTETQARYRRSVLGPLWITIGTLLGSFGLALIWSEIFSITVIDFIPYVTLGIVIWQTLSGVLTESSGNFYRSASTLQERPISPFFLTYQLVLKGFINLGHSVPLVILIISFINGGFHGTELWAIPGVALMLLNLIWLTHVIAFLGARYRDIEPLLTNVMPIIFFCTPILYEVERLGSFRMVADLNPLVYFIEVVRGPLIGKVPSLSTYVAMFCVALIGLQIGHLVTKRYERRLLHWI